MGKVIKLEYVKEAEIWEPETLYAPEGKLPLGRWEWLSKGYYMTITDEFLIYRMEHYTLISEIKRKYLEIILTERDPVKKIHMWGLDGYFCSILLNEKEEKFFTYEVYRSKYTVISNLKRCYISTIDSIIGILEKYENTNLEDWKYVPSALFDGYTTKILKQMWKTIKKEVINL